MDHAKDNPEVLEGNTKAFLPEPYKTHILEGVIGLHDVPDKILGKAKLEGEADYYQKKIIVAEMRHHKNRR